MKPILIVLILAASLGVAGAQEKQSEPMKGMGQGAATMAMMQNCPLDVKGVEIAAADTATGIALTFTTATGNIDELRRRIQAMADMHGAAATFAAIPNGGRIVLSPKDPVQLEEFQKQVRAHVVRMTKDGGCAEMMGMMQQMMDGKMPGMMPASAGKPATESQAEPKKEAPAVDHSQHHPEENK